MKKIVKIAGKVLLFTLCGILAVILLVIGGLNVAKFVIYDDYYAIKTDVCKNPGLSDGFVCQGITISEENNVILVSGYMKDDSNSRIYVTTLDNKSYYVELTRNTKSFTGHAGGIATSGENVYIASGNKIYTVKLSDLLNAKNGDVIDIGSGIKVNNDASFCYTDDEYLYVGEFHDGGAYIVEGHENETAEGMHYAICSQYSLSDLTKPVKIYSVRNKVQGIAFAPDGTVLMATSYGLTNSVYYVYNVNDATDSGKTMDGAPLFYLDTLVDTLEGPAMAEGVDYYNGEFITLTESASNKYLFGKLFGATKIVSLDI